MSEPQQTSSTPPTGEEAGPAVDANAGAKLLVDLGPLAVFILTYWRTDVITATAVFMAASGLALVYSKLKFKHISPMLMFSSVMILVFGSLTIWLHDEAFIKIKPTIYYSFISIILFVGVLRKKPALKAVMGPVYPELNDKGWHLLGRNFAWFFVGMAILNEIVWRNSSFGFWLGYKLWGALPLTILFGALNVPMIMRNSAPPPESAA
jgi:intracellular septation protein